MNTYYPMCFQSEFDGLVRAAGIRDTVDYHAFEMMMSS